MSEQRKKTTSLDLDGVLNIYSGTKDFNPHVICPPREDTRAFLERLYEKRNIEIYTVRDLRTVRKWAREYGLENFISAYTHCKNPYASEFGDDRAVYFDGNYDHFLDEILNTTPHWQKH